MQYTVYVNSTGGVIEPIMVVRDALRPDVYYYAATRPRLAMQGNEPVFALTRYQSKDPQNRQAVVEGAFMQFAVRLDPTPEALANLKPAVVKVAQKAGYNGEIRLSPLPYKSIRMSTYTPRGLLMSTGAPDQKGMTTGFATTEIPFTVSLNRVGADVFADLCESNTGIPVWVDYTYASISPPAGFEITVDWKTTFSHVSSSKSSTTAIGFAGSGLSFQNDKDKVRETLVSNKCISVKPVGNASFKNEDIDRYLDPILIRIYDELFDQTQTKVTDVNPYAMQQAGNSPAKLLDAALAPLKPSNGILQFNSYFALKKVEKTRTDKQVIEMNRRRYEESRGGCGGFLGIGPLVAKNPALKSKLITVAPAGDWPQATFLLPKMQAVRELGITEVTLSLAIFDDVGQVRGDGTQQSVKWTAAGADDEWHAAAGDEKRSLLLVPMASLYQRYRDHLDVLKYRVEATVTQKTRSGTRPLKVTRFVPLTRGDVPIATPLSFFDVWHVNAEGIDFAASGLSQRTATLIQGGARQSATITADAADKRPAFLFPSADQGPAAPVTLNIQYVVNKKVIESAFNKLTDVTSFGPEFFLYPEWENASDTGK